MRKFLLRTGVLITSGLLIIGIISGCTDDPPEEVVGPPQPQDDVPLPSTIKVDVPLPSTIKVIVDPAPPANPNWRVSRNTEFTLTFNQSVSAVTVNGAAASGSGLDWTVAPPLLHGMMSLNIEWVNQDGSTDTREVGPYFFSDIHGEPPVITSSTVWDGDVDVDPAVMNAGIRFDFNEPVTGTIKLTDEAGVDLNWTAVVADQTATMTPVAGQEMVNETTYKIEIHVADGAGNPFQLTITFVTKPK